MADNTDIKDHVATYSGMITLLKWGTGISIIIAALVIWIIQ